MASLFLILFGMTIGFCSGVILAALMFAAKQPDTSSEDEFKNLAHLKTL